MPELETPLQLGALVASVAVVVAACVYLGWQAAAGQLRDPRRDGDGEQRPWR